MSTVNLPSQTTETNNSTPASWRDWGTTFLNTTWKRASRAYSYSKNAAYVVGRLTSRAGSSAKDQITTLANTLFPKGLLVSTKDLTIRLTTDIYNSSTKTKVAAVSLLALGYAYSQAPSFDDTMKRLIEEVMKDHPSSKSSECNSMTTQITASVAISSFVNFMITKHLQLPVHKNEAEALMNYRLIALEGTVAEQFQLYNPLIEELRGRIKTLDAKTFQTRASTPFSPFPPSYRDAFTPNDSRLDASQISTFLT